MASRRAGFFNSLEDRTHTLDVGTNSWLDSSRTTYALYASTRHDLDVVVFCEPPPSDFYSIFTIRLKASEQS